jgi:NAD(P)-dependent dehydrogenase (short-subunit alcohol dehydrogenase family)
LIQYSTGLHHLLKEFCHSKQQYMWTKKDMPGQQGKKVLITGANSGIGFETALAFYEKGAHVIMACRDAGKAQSAVKKIKQHAGTGTLEVASLQLDDLQQIRQLTDELREQHQQLDMLINNAGVMVPPMSRTKDGFELQFGVNFMGHFALTGLLYPLIRNAKNARIVTVSSLAYTKGKIDPDNLRIEKGYDAWREYNQSKLANILFTLELQRRIDEGNDPVISVAAQPGVVDTDLSRFMGQDGIAAAIQQLGELMTPMQGALPTLYAATAKDIDKGALYGPDQDGGLRGYPAKGTILPGVVNAETAQQLWSYAERACPYPLQW